MAPHHMPLSLPWRQLSNTNTPGFTLLHPPIPLWGGSTSISGTTTPDWFFFYFLKYCLMKWQIFQSWRLSSNFSVYFQVHLLPILPDDTEWVKWLCRPTRGDSRKPDISNPHRAFTLPAGTQGGEKIGETSVLHSCYIFKFVYIILSPVHLI